MSGRKLQLNQWIIEITTGDLRVFTRSFEETMQTAPIDKLEPKAVFLLSILAKYPHETIDKQQLMDAVWPEQTVTPDTLVRCVSKIRKALNDDPKRAQIIKTVPRQGYQLIAETLEWHSPLALPSANLPKPDASVVINQESNADRESQDETESDNQLTQRKRHPLSLVFGALGLFIAFAAGLFLVNPNLVDTDRINETQLLVDQAQRQLVILTPARAQSAIQLYQSAIQQYDDASAAHAGLAVALAIDVALTEYKLTFPQMPIDFVTQLAQVEHALTQSSRNTLNRALAAAKYAIKLAPNEANGHASLAFVLSVQKQWQRALASYSKALSLAPNDWRILMRQAEVLVMVGQKAEAVPVMEQAFAMMGQAKAQDSLTIQPLHSALGTRIGQFHVDLAKYTAAERWYLHVLDMAPFYPDAVAALASLYRQTDRDDQAEKLCLDSIARLGQDVCGVSD